MASDRKLKCRFCDWSTPAWYTVPGGQRRSGMSLLREHVQDEHPDEEQALQAKLAGIPTPK